MAGDTVSLGEILSARGDAANAFGSPEGGDAAVLPFNQGLAFLSSAADAKVQADQFKYKEFQDNMNKFYTNFNTIDITGVSPADQKAINAKYAEVAKLNADNIDVIKNPNSNEAKYSEIKQNESQLLAMIAASKMHKAYDDKSLDFTKANPDWHEVNKDKIVDSQSTATDNWKPYSLDAPFTFDPVAAVKVIEPIAQQKYADATVGKGYITEEEGTRIQHQAWDDAFNTYANATVKNGKTVRDIALEARKKLPPELQGASEEDYINKWRDSIRPQDQVTKKTITPDATFNSEETRKLTASEGAADRWNRYRIALLGLEKGDKKVDVAGVGRLYNEELTGFKTGQFSTQALQNIYGDDTKVKIKAGTEIVDPQNPLSKTTTGSEVDVPSKLVISSTLDADGNLVYKYIDYGHGQTAAGGGGFFAKKAVENVGGYPVITSAPVPFKQGRTDFYNILGDKYPARVADVAEKFRIQRKLGVNPDLEILNNYFWKPEDKATPTATVDPEYLKLTGPVKNGKDGKKYKEVGNGVWMAEDGTKVIKK